MLILCAVFFVFSPRDKKKYAAAMLFSILAADGLVDWLKHFIGRPRPFEVLTAVNLMDSARKGVSFPSGHSAMVFVMAFVFGRVYKKAIYALFTIATLVAFSRVYLGLHYVSDIVAGAVIGVAVSYVVSKVTIKFLDKHKYLQPRS